MKNVFPTFRGENDDGSVNIDMIDRFGRTWARGTGESRTDAIARARKSAPPPGLIRRILSSAVAHPMRTALLTATAYHTFHAIAQRDGEERLSFSGLMTATAIAYVGIKILTWVFGKNLTSET